MKRAIIGALALVLMAGVAWTQDRAAQIQTVIQSQFDAFEVDDFATAFTFASPMIQQMFQTPERFGQMVQQGYPMVHRPRSVEFSDVTERGGRMFQDVLVTDRAGTMHLLEYEMLESDDGWEINGVRFKKPVAIGA